MNWNKKNLFYTLSKNRDGCASSHYHSAKGREDVLAIKAIIIPERVTGS